MVILELDRADELAPLPREGRDQMCARVCREQVVLGAARDFEP
jgi:hypothetical protein